MLQAFYFCMRGMQKLEPTHATCPGPGLLLGADVTWPAASVRPHRHKRGSPVTTITHNALQKTKPEARLPGFGIHFAITPKHGIPLHS